MKHDVKTIFQREDGLYPVNDKLLTEEELDKLIGLMQDSRWIIIKYPSQKAYSKVIESPQSDEIR